MVSLIIINLVNNLFCLEWYLNFLASCITFCSGCSPLGISFSLHQEMAALTLERLLCVRSVLMSWKETTSQF